MNQRLLERWLAHNKWYLLWFGYEEDLVLPESTKRLFPLSGRKRDEASDERNASTNLESKETVGTVGAGGEGSPTALAIRESGALVVRQPAALMELVRWRPETPEQKLAIGGAALLLFVVLRFLFSRRG